jgi:hypothetical protein
MSARTNSWIPPVRAIGGPFGAFPLLPPVFGALPVFGAPPDFAADPGGAPCHRGSADDLIESGKG